MDLVRSIVALVLAAFWLPASSHVHLQHLGLIHELHEDHPHPHHETDHPDHETDHPDHEEGASSSGSGRHEHAEDNHAAADGQCLLSPQTPSPAPSGCGVAPSELALGLPASVIGLPAPRESSGLAPPATGPPEIPRSWQFLLRAALPVRAPSPVS